MSLGRHAATVKSVGRGIGRVTDFVIEKGAGAFIYTSEGRKILDFTAGIGVVNLGHCHPDVTAAVVEQASKITHAQVNLCYSGPALDLIHDLLPIMPDKSLDSFIFLNSGAEALENSVKLARAATKRQNVIVMQGGYHGRTFGAMALTRSKTGYFEGFGPLMPGVFTAPFPYWHQLGVDPKTSEEEMVKSCVHQLELLLKQQSAPSDTCAILIEPVIGEGGYVPAPASYLKALREICDKHGILLIFDEVQCGFGRTGKLFASQHSGVVPDIMTMAKGIANGFPISAIVSKKEITDKQLPGSMGGTYSSNAVSCAAARASVKALTTGNILDNVNARSKELFDCLYAIQNDASTGKYVADVRGVGLMVAIEFTTNEFASAVQKACLEKDLFVLTTSIFGTLRFIPPLVISKEEMAQACKILTETVKEVASKQ